ncbi:hypothetical protein ACEPPN_005100 [Leptodophora sp. 'Broadleaf-Isolate-01']
MSDHQSLAIVASSAASILQNGALDVIIVNGFACQHELLQQDMHASLDVNVIGVVNSINSFLPLILKGKAKKIMVISTGGADPDLAVAYNLPYQFTMCVMKAALNIVVAKFAAELKSRHVKVLALSPG